MRILSGSLFKIIVSILWLGLSAVHAEDSGDYQKELLKLRLRGFNIERDLDRIKIAQERQERQWQTLISRQTESENTSEQLIYLQKMREIWSEQKTLLETQLKYVDLISETYEYDRSFQRKKLNFDQVKRWRNYYDETLKQCERDFRFYEAKKLNLLEDIKGFVEIAKDKKEKKALLFFNVNEKSINTLLEAHVSNYEQVLAEIKLEIKLLDQAQAHLQEKLRLIPLTNRLWGYMKGMSSFWYVEVLHAGNESITLGKVVLAFIFLIMGYFFSKFLSLFLRRSLRKKTQISVGSTDSIQKLSFYVLLLVCALVSLKSLDVPLTAFAFLGGAVALGLGFGSQNIVNNFISGLILLIEQPVKAKDYVEVEGILCEVEHIGMRSTRVKTLDNIHLVIPNSTFLEKNVTNWTLSDEVVRASVTVGVAYGSPTDRVRKLMLQAANEHKLVLKAPSPWVLFENFGDNSLEFRIYFWFKVVQMNDRYRIESDLRFIIDSLFRRNNIVVAFPQRDVHLDMSEPMDVRIVTATETVPLCDI